MRIAALDLGSNSFHLLAVEAHPDGSFDTLVREKEMLRLGDRVARTGVIGGEGRERVLETMRRMAALIARVGVDEVVACATSAFREAQDSADVCDAIFDETGIAVEVISGRREARLIFSAVRRSVSLTDPPAVVVDLGGGSLEIAVGDARGVRWATSLHLGAGRLATTFLTRDPPDEADLRALRSHVEAVLAPALAEVASFEPRMIVATSGTFCDLALHATARRVGTVPPTANQLRVGRDALEDAHRALAGLRSADRAKLPGIETRRADQLPAGSVVLLAVLSMLDMDELVTGEWALREGIVLEAIDRHDLADWSDDPEAVRRASVLALARRCQYDEVHAGAVARLGVRLFDQTSALHGLAPRARTLLEYGALLHDIGEHVAVEGHNKHTAYLIQNGRLRGFEPAEIDVLAVLGRFHRRGGPANSFEPWKRLDRHRKAETEALLAILRVADGLDRSHAGTVDDIDVDLDDDVVRLIISARAEVDLEVWGVRRKRGLFESIFGRRLELVAADHPSLGAQVAGGGGRDR